MQTSFTLTFTAEQIQVIDKALQQVPYFIAKPMLDEINRQLDALADKKTAEVIPWKSAPPGA